MKGQKGEPGPPGLDQPCPVVRVRAGGVSQPRSSPPPANISLVLRVYLQVPEATLALPWSAHTARATNVVTPVIEAPLALCPHGCSLGYPPPLYRGRPSLDSLFAGITASLYSASLATEEGRTALASLVAPRCPPASLPHVPDPSVPCSLQPSSFLLSHHSP